MPASHQEKSETVRERSDMASLAIRVVCVSLPLAALVFSLHGHADFQAFAASKITAGHVDQQCKKVPPSSETTAIPILCSLDSKRLVIEASGGRTVAVRADAVLFERRFDAKTEAQDSGTARDLMARDRSLLIRSGIPVDSISTSLSQTPPLLTVTIRDPSVANVAAFRHTIAELQTNSGFTNPITQFDIRYLKDCTALDEREKRDAYADALGTASSLGELLSSQLLTRGVRLPLSSDGPRERNDIRCGAGHLLESNVFVNSDLAETDIASSRLVDAFFNATRTRVFKVTASDLSFNGRSMVTSLAGPPKRAVLKARYLIPAEVPQIFASGSSFRESAMLQEIAMPAFALKLATWRAQIAAAARGFETASIDGLIAYDTIPEYTEPPLAFETQSSRSTGVFLSMHSTGAPIASPEPSTYERPERQTPKPGTVSSRITVVEPIEDRLPFAKSHNAMTNATVIVRAPSETTLILFHFHRDNRAFTDEERARSSQAIYVDSGEDFIPYQPSTQPYDITVGGWIQKVTSERIARLVAAAKHFEAETTAHATALYHSTVYDCLPLEQQSITAAAIEAYRDARAFADRPNEASQAIRTIGVLGPFVSQGACGQAALTFPPDADAKRFPQRLEDVGDPDVVMESSVGITFDRLNP